MVVDSGLRSRKFNLRVAASNDSSSQSKLRRQSNMGRSNEWTFETGYLEAAKKEIDILEHMDVWDEVPRRAHINVLPGTWAFKCKRYPDGSVRKLKGRFCCRGDRQKDGVDYDSSQIFAPVVSWQTVRLLLIVDCARS